MPLRELKLLEASRNGNLLINPPHLLWSVCKNQLTRFHTNAMMTLALGGSTPWSAMMAVEWEKAGAATKQVALPSEAEEARMRIMELLTDLPKDIRDQMLIDHAKNLDNWATRCGPFIHRLLEDILKAMCVHAWTVIEVLIEDLHGAVIDKYGAACFSQEIIDKRELTKNAQDGGFRFRTRDAFLKSYKKAFANDVTIKAALDCDAIDTLCVLRNLIVHKDAVVDQYCIDKDLPTAKGMKAFPSLAKDQPLMFDGDVVRTIIDNAFEEGHSLLTAVDAWLTANNPNPPS